MALFEYLPATRSPKVKLHRAQKTLVHATSPRVVIVGAGFGGLSAAKQLARAPFDVTVVDRHNYHLFQPLLYQVVTAGLSPGDIASPIRGILHRQMGDSDKPKNYAYSTAERTDLVEAI
jgi:NADH dehydrogenase FAD-containing subunit